ncbi:MAG: hypothetical protein IT453_22690 [Planctomycetes bacterium]|nr:hypothetical protein [Planctomycetota bacterium]
MWSLLLLSLAAQSSTPASGAAQAPARESLVTYDDLSDRCVHWDAHLIQPLTLASGGFRLFALNQPGCRLVIFDPATLAKNAEIPLGPGAVSVVERSGTNELWITDCVTSSVTIVDLAALTITRSIRVGAEPHGIAFTPNGDRAYVACSAARTIDVISTATYQVVASIPVPVREPRALVHADGKAWVVPLVSGNDTAPMGTGSANGQVQNITSVEKLSSLGLPSLPDRDLLAIATQVDPAQDYWLSSATRTGLGTALLNLHVRPGTTELWIPNTEALNTQSKGEASFIAGQVVSNRITVVDVATAAAPSIVDLDALAPAGVRCAQPTGLVFDPVRPRVYVCGYGSDLVAVLDLSGPTPTWAGKIDLPNKQVYPKFTGPRTACVDATGHYLYVLNKGDNSLSRVDLTTLPTSLPFSVSAASPLTLGFEPLSGEERQGRNHFINARNSKSLTSSCASCHVDGRTDGTAWDLSLFLDPETTPKGSLSFPVDDKGPLVTQNTQRMAESGPYHWRGEKERIIDFNASFIDLLERNVAGVPKHLGPDFRYLEHYIKRLAYHANPAQDFERGLSQLEMQGAVLFKTKPVFQGVSCAGCHQLPLGTSGEVTKSHVPGKFAQADVAQLRGLAEKFSSPLTIGGAFGKRTELGAGLSHGGAYASLRDLLLGPDPDDPSKQAFALTSDEANAIAAFLVAFDTGLAPSTAHQFTVDATTASGSGAQELDALLTQARRGHCDVVARCGPTTVLGKTAWRSALYDPAQDRFVWARAIAAPSSPQALLGLASQGTPVTFLGVPRLMGRSMGIDRDMDMALDLDELSQGTDPEELDTDDDGFPDGYELKWGMDPLVAGGSSPDVQAPSLLGTPRVIFATTNTIKFVFETDEVCRVQISYNGGIPVARLPLQNDFDFEFSATINELSPATLYAFDLELLDPAGNVVHVPFTAKTRPRLFGDPAYVQDVVSVIATVGVDTVLQSTVTLRNGQVATAPGYDVEGSVLYVDATGTVTTLAASVHALSDASGVARIDVTLPASGLAHPGSLWFVVRSVTAPLNQPKWSKALDTRSWRSVVW